MHIDIDALLPIPQGSGFRLLVKYLPFGKFGAVGIYDFKISVLPQIKVGICAAAVMLFLTACAPAASGPADSKSVSVLEVQQILNSYKTDEGYGFMKYLYSSPDSISSGRSSAAR